MIRKILSGTFLGLAIFGLTTQIAQAQVNEQRQKLMKQQSAAAKALKGAVEGKDFATVEAKAKDIMGTSDRIVGLFPAGSNTGKTKAKPEIWEKSDDFAKEAKNLSKAAGELAAAAKAGNEAEVGAKFKAVGASCSSCHKQFRASKYSE